MSLGACPVCGAAAPRPFFSLSGVPVYCNVLWPTRDEAVAAPRADITLSLCGTCGLVWNTSFEPADVDYGVEYENSLHYSQAFHEHASRLAERLVGDRGMNNVRVLDVGCGKGDFLALLCADGRNRGIGFDPSYEGAHDDSAWLDFHRDFYPDDGSGPRAELVIARHVLEHVAEPHAFAQLLRSAVGDGGMVYVEVPAAEHMLGAGAVWDVIYEHCTYFTEPALSRLMRNNGFEVLRTGTSFGGQYLWLEATPESRGAERPPPDYEPRVRELAQLAEGFANTFAAAVGGAGRAIGRGTVALWGAGSKGVTFLNVADRERSVAAVVDLNPRKQGRHVPGSGQRILGPNELRAVDPETVLVMNPLYVGEIERLVRESGLDAEVVLV